MLETYRQTAEISSVNLRNELHGDDKVGAVDIGIAMTVPNTFLRMLGSHLLVMFYKSATSGQAELLDHLPDLRAPELGMPIKHEYVGSGYDVELNYGMNNDKALRFADCQVDKIKLDMKAGGSVDVSLRILAHPKPKDVGALYELNGSEIELSLLPPAESAESSAPESTGLFDGLEDPDIDSPTTERTGPVDVLYETAIARVRAGCDPKALHLELKLSAVEAANYISCMIDDGVLEEVEGEYVVVAADDAA